MAFCSLRIRLVYLIVLTSCQLSYIVSWAPKILQRTPALTRRTPLFTATNVDGAALDTTDDDDDEYEYIEIDALTEDDLVGSEWIVGTCLDDEDDQAKIDETWVRLVVDDKGKNVAVWGDNSEGSWKIDTASGFFSASKESIWRGKQIWACNADDYYYLQGTVRGWSLLASASVLGQWQARRLGVEEGEAGVAPWFQEDEEEETPTSPLEASSADTETSVEIAEESAVAVAASSIVEPATEKDATAVEETDLSTSSNIDGSEEASISASSESESSGSSGGDDGGDSGSDD